MAQRKTDNEDCRILSYKAENPSDNQKQEDRKSPIPSKTGEKAQIDEETERIILEAHKQFSLGPAHLERKIEEIHGKRIPHNTIYILLKHGLVEENMKKKKQRKWVRFERKHSGCGRETGS